MGKDQEEVMTAKTELTDEVPAGRDHRDLKDNGQQLAYVVLTAEERAKGFVRPMRRKYIHSGISPTWVGDTGDLLKPGERGCGCLTIMGQAIAETYARDPKFYTGTFCVGCGEHRPLDEFTWDGTREQVGS